MTDPVILHTYKMDHAVDGKFDGIFETIGQADTGDLYLIKTTGALTTYEKIAGNSGSDNFFEYSWDAHLDVDGDGKGDLIRYNKGNKEMTVR